MRIFFYKAINIAAASGDPLLEPRWPLVPRPTLLLPAITTLSSSISSVKCVFLLSKEIKTIVNVLVLLLLHFCTYFSLQTL